MSLFVKESFNHFILIPMSEFDVILDMDWLVLYVAVIEYRAHIVRIQGLEDD